MNRLLKRQIRRHLGGIENVPESLLSFLGAIDRSYTHYEDDRLLLEQSMEISSGELEESNEQLHADALKQKEILQRLKESLNTLLSVDVEGGDETSFIEEEDDVLKVIDFIEIQSRHIKAVEEEILQVQHFINQSNDAIQVMDAEGKLVFANDNALSWMDSTRASSYGSSIFHLDSKFEGEVAWNEMLEHLEEENPMILSKQQMNRTSNFPVEMSVKRVKLQDDDFIISVARDITTRKKAEERQEELIDDLRKVNEELENFAYIVSHDLKAPIRGIGSVADWLKQDYAHLMDDEGKNLLELMKRRVLRMQQLIEGILSYSRIGRKDGEKVEIDVNIILDEVVDTVARGLASNDFHLVVPAKLPIIIHNEVRIRQIFQNLISNAIKYGDQEKCVVEVTSKDVGDFWEFCVEDNGPGIKSVYHTRIFKIFQTLQARDKFESTGVGLSIIKKIVEQGNGEIWIESEEGKGARFLFTLPK
jgi:two-component system sensor kinase FixL